MFFILGTIIVLSIFIGGNLLIHFADYGRLCVVATILCLLGFFFTGSLSSPELRKLRKAASGKEVIARAQQINRPGVLAMENRIFPGFPRGIPRAEEFSKKVLAASKILRENKVEPPPEDIDNEKNLTVPELLGTGGIYGIVLGLGIFEALGKYVEKTTGGLVNYFNNTAINQTIGNFTNSTNITLSIAPILQSNLPEALRLSGFLFTLIPFVHGTMLMFSKKWYHDTEYKPHYFVALIYFIVIFIITIMYLFIAVNIMDSALFLYSLWILMAFNSVWLVVYSKILKSKLKKQFLIHREWIFLDLNTLAFLSVFLFASPNLLSINKVVESDSAFNFLIFIILFSRALTGYIVSWSEFYQPAIIPSKGSTHTALQDTQEVLLFLPKKAIQINETIPLLATLTELKSGQDLSAYFFVDDDSIVSITKKERKFSDLGVAMTSLKGERSGTTFITVLVRGGMDLHVTREITVEEQDKNQPKRKS